MTVKERIAALRDKMRANGIDAYIVFDSDEHMSEYLPEYYRERSWISGFTGSAGTVVVTQRPVSGPMDAIICRLPASSAEAVSPCSGLRTPV